MTCGSGRSSKECERKLNRIVKEKVEEIVGLMMVKGGAEEFGFDER